MTDRTAGEFDASAPMSRRERREREEATRRTAVVRPQFRTTDVPPRADDLKRAPRKRRKPVRSGAGIGSKLLSLGAMVGAIALMVGMSIPAALAPNSASAQGDAAAVAEAASATMTDAGRVQELSVSETAAAAAVTRDAYTATSWAEMLKARYVASAARDFNYNGGGVGPVRWPFPATVEISSGFGARAAPCRGCSSDHKGLDFVPGAGTPIFAVADGVVTKSEYAGAFGQHVTIAHTIDGQSVSSLYAHMQAGSSPLVVGQQIKVGDFVGLVGRTGAATGAHLHFEIAVDGTPVDPFTYLKTKAG